MLAISILKPVVALAAWTMVMWLWLYATRLPALAALDIDMDDIANDRKMTLDRLLSPKVQRVAHNYNHLHEAPTVFYVICFVLAVTGSGNGNGALIAWAYVGLRVLHSLVQATVDKIPLRFALFAASTMCLMVLIFRAGQVLWAY